MTPSWRPNPRVNWTNQDLGVLITGVRNRELATTIARKLGRTKNSVLGKAWKIGLHWNLSPTEKSARSQTSALKNPKRFQWAKGQRGHGGVDKRFDYS